MRNVALKIQNKQKENKGNIVEDLKINSLPKCTVTKQTNNGKRITLLNHVSSVNNNNNGRGLLSLMSKG